MPLSDQELADDACSGTVEAAFRDRGQVYDAIERFLQDTLPRCILRLPGIRDGSIAKAGESLLCEHLCRWLNSFALGQELFEFVPEVSDRGHGGRAPDFSAFPAVGPDALIQIGGHDYNCTEVLYVIEAKRLPPPPSTAREDRSREYVVSDWQHRDERDKSRTGGIERFKERLHGSPYERAGMIGFIQDQTPDHWLAAINSWIEDLIARAIPRHQARWMVADLLSHLAVQPSVTRLWQYRSSHDRSPKLPPISLRHFWLVLT